MFLKTTKSGVDLLNVLIEYKQKKNLKIKLTILI